MNAETRQQVSEKMNREARILNNTLIDQVCEFPPGIPGCSIPGGTMSMLTLLALSWQALEEGKAQKM